VISSGVVLGAANTVALLLAPCQSALNAPHRAASRQRHDVGCSHGHHVGTS